jgi:hypothetical protein
MKKKRRRKMNLKKMKDQ